MSDEIDEAREQVLEDATSGVQSVTADGVTVTGASLRSRLEALRELERREQAASGISPIRITPIRTKGI